MGRAEELKARADQALYEAKRGGRDRAVVWGTLAAVGAAASRSR